MPAFVPPLIPALSIRTPHAPVQPVGQPTENGTHVQHPHNDTAPPFPHAPLQHAHPHSHSHEQHHDHPASHPHSHPHSHSHSHSHSHDGSGCSGGHGLFAHQHDHSHLARAPHSRRALKIALWINIAFLIAEVVGGIVYNSIALLSDAAHMLTDVGALALALVAAHLATRPATHRRTYGLGRVENLAALINAATLVGASIWILFEATSRLLNPHPVNGGGVMAIAFAGLLANAVATWVLLKADQSNLNIRAAMMHSLMDAISSVGVLVAGALIALGGWYAVDPLMSYVIAALSVVGTWGILRSSLDSLLDATPAGLEADAVAERILAEPFVREVHDVHIWSITTNSYAMTAHILVNPTVDVGEALEALSYRIRTDLGIEHCTLQVAPDRTRTLLGVHRRLTHPRASS